MALTLTLLTLSNIFMTFAWYYHLGHKNWSLPLAIAISWAIAGLEYCLAVPANRIGSNAGLSTTQLKVIQEAITLLVFGVFVVVVMKEKLAWNHGVAFLFLVLAVFFVFHKWDRAPLARHDSDPSPPAVSLQRDRTE